VGGRGIDRKPLGPVRSGPFKTQKFTAFILKEVRMRIEQGIIQKKAL
jgi:hypothetical protein